jgi:hypothetical protein
MLLREVLTVAWVFWPLTFFVQRQLAQRTLEVADRPRPNVRFLLAWTATAAMILGALRHFAQYHEALNMYPEPLERYVVRLPWSVVESLSAACVMVALSLRPRHWLWSVPLAASFHFASEQVLIWMTDLAGSSKIYGVMAGPLDERLPHFAGRSLTLIVVFALASVTGLKFRRIEPHASSQSKVAKQASPGSA